MTRGQPKDDPASSAPPSIGLSAEAKLRGTAVMLAAAGRSSGETTDMTKDVRVGTSIWDKALRTIRRIKVQARFGANGASARQRLAGRWVNTIVFTNPIRSEIHAAAKYEKAESR